MSKLLVTGGAGFLALTESLWFLLNPNSEGIKVLLEKGSYNSAVRRKTEESIK